MHGSRSARISFWNHLKKKEIISNHLQRDISSRRACCDWSREAAAALASHRARQRIQEATVSSGVAKEIEAVSLLSEPGGSFTTQDKSEVFSADPRGPLWEPADPSRIRITNTIHSKRNSVLLLWVVEWSVLEWLIDVVYRLSHTQRYQAYYHLYRWEWVVKFPHPL